VDWALWSTVGGMLQEIEGKMLYEQALVLPEGATIVEIGCYEGRSTTALLGACRDSEGMRKRVITVDNFSGDGMTEGRSTAESKGSGLAGLYSNVSRLGLKDWLHDVFAVTSWEWFDEYARYDEELGFKMFFIDGCHSCVAEDMKRAWTMLSPGGVLICHDYHTDNPGFAWIKELIDSVGLNGQPMRQGTSFYRAVKE